MAAKSSKGPNYAELAEYFSGVPAGKTLVDLDELNKLLEDTKRVQVINWDTMFDHSLKNLLLIHFSRRNKNVQKLFEPSNGGPLVSLTHKARLAYALGIIDKTFLNDLEHIHKIRNEFAHSIEINFSDTKVLKFVEKLSTAKGHKVTAKNSHTLYKNANNKCLKSLKKVSQQEIYRQAMLQEAKKKGQKS